MGGGPLDFSVRSSPLGTNLGFELGLTGLGLGLGGFGAKGLGPGLDNIYKIGGISLFNSCQWQIQSYLLAFLSVKSEIENVLLLEPLPA